MRLSISKIKRNFENIFVDVITDCKPYKHIDHSDMVYYFKKNRLYFTVSEKFLHVVYEDCWSICEKDYEMSHIEAKKFVKHILKLHYDINNIDKVSIGPLDRSWFSVLERQYRFRRFRYLIIKILEFLEIDLKVKLHYIKL